MYYNSSFNFTSFWTSVPRQTRMYLMDVWQYIFYIFMLQKSFIFLRSVAHLLMQLHRLSMFVSGGRRRMMLEARRKDL